MSATLGREAEIGVVRAAVDDTAAHHGTVVLIAGDAGIGKSRLLSDAARLASSAGLDVFRGHAYASEGVPAYWPVLEAVSSVPSAHARRAAELLSPGGESAGSRFGLLRAAAESLRELGDANGALLLLDDLHWADAATVALLMHLVRLIPGSRLSLVVTHRPIALEPSHPLHDLIALVRTERLGSRITLAPLERGDARSLALASGGASLDDAALSVLVARGEGNPFLIEELAREASLVSGAVPQGVREVVAQRVARLSPDGVAFVRAAAVLGDGATVGDLAALLEATPGAALDECARAGLVESAGVSIRFHHALLRDATYEAIPPGARAELHRRAGLTLAQLYRGRAARAAEVAEHLRRSGAAELDDEIARHAELAGDAATEVFAFEEAARLYALALAHASSDARQRLLLALADAHLASGRYREALDEFERAFRSALSANELARAAIGFEDAFFDTGAPRSGPADPTVALLFEAGQRSTELVPALRARLHAALARALFFAGQLDRADDLSRRALDEARAAGDQGTLAYALDVRRIVLWGPDHLAERLAQTAELMRIAETARDRERWLTGLYWRIAAMVEAGEIREAGVECERFAVEAERLRHPLHLARRAHLRGMFAQLAGDLRAVERWAEEGLRESERAGYADGRIHYVAAMLAVRRERGGYADFIAEIIAEPEVWLRSAPRRAMFSYLLAEAGEVDRAGGIARELAAAGFAEVPRDWLWLPLLCYVADVAERAGLAVVAEVLYPLLLPYRDSFAVNSNAVCLGSIERSLGQLALARGDMGTAREHLAIAVDRNIRAGAPVWATRSRALLDRAAAVGGLTAREREVLRLLADGNSYKEIADALVLSVRTIERHVANLYDKIGARGKADAVAYAVREGIASAR